jgi:hypothetical protein
MSNRDDRLILIRSRDVDDEPMDISINLDPQSGTVIMWTKPAALTGCRRQLGLSLAPAALVGTLRSARISRALVAVS